MDSDSWVEAEVNFLRREKLCRRDYLNYLKNRAKSGDMAVLELSFRNVSLGKWSKNWSCYRRQQSWDRISRSQSNQWLVWYSKQTQARKLELWTKVCCGNETIRRYCKRDLDAANMRPALEQGCGKQTPSARKLFFRANLVYIPNIKV